MADSDLIALLNGEQASPSLFGRDEEDHALLDEDGLPNDKFLEVVKAELVSFENRRKNEMRLRESGSTSLRKGGKKNDDDEYFRAGLHRPEYDSNEDVDEDEDSDDSSYRPNDSAFSEDDDEEEEEESSFEARKLFAKRDIKSRPRSVAKGTDDRRSKKSKGSRKKVKKITASSSVISTRSRNSLVPAAATRQSIRGSRSPLRKSKEKGEEDESNNLKNNNELFHVEMETKLSTCMLRIRGLLNTIKSLEGKLVTSNAEIEDKTSQLKSLQKKIHAIECKEKMRYQGRSRDEYAALVSQLEQQLAKTRKLQEQTHSKLIEEKRLRNNADERCKSLRQNGERQKATINDLHSNLKLNRQELSDLQQKTQRIRSDHKSVTSEAQTLKETLGGAELEYKRLKNKTSEQVNEIRMLKSENENLRDDNRKIKHELFAAQDRIRHMSLELEVAKEKENTRKAEHRFQNRRLQKASVTKNSIPNDHRGNEFVDASPVGTDDVSAEWDSDSNSNTPIKATNAVPFYGSTSSARSIIAEGIAESNRRANKQYNGTTTPVHSSYVANRPTLRTAGFSGSNSSLGMGSKGGLRIASPARPPLSNNRGRQLDKATDRGRGHDIGEDINDNNNMNEDEESVDEVMRSSISSLPPHPPSASKLPMRAHSMSPLRRNENDNTSTEVSLLAPPSPAGSDVSGRFSRLQKMYERVAAKEQSREIVATGGRPNFD